MFFIDPGAIENAVNLALMSLLAAAVGFFSLLFSGGYRRKRPANKTDMRRLLTHLPQGASAVTALGVFFTGGYSIYGIFFVIWAVFFSTTYALGKKCGKALAGPPVAAKSGTMSDYPKGPWTCSRCGVTNDRVFLRCECGVEWQPDKNETAPDTHKSW